MFNTPRPLLAALFALAVSFPSIAAQAPSRAPQGRDIEAMRTAAEMQAYARKLASVGAPSEAEQRKAQALLERAAQLALGVERGDVTLNTGAQRALARAIESLEAARSEARAQPESTSPKATAANGTISGAITDAVSGLPVPDGVKVQVNEFSTQSGFVSSAATTGGTGTYSVSVPPGKYHVRIQASSLTAQVATRNYLAMAYNGVPCAVPVNCPRYVGTIVTVTSGGTTPGINFALPHGGGISGTVRKASDNSALAGISVQAIGENGGSGFTVTDGSGNYTFTGLAPARYRVAAVPGNISGLLGVQHNNVPCGEGDCTLLPGNLVTVTADSTASGIDFSLPATASVSGTVTDGVSPAASADVYLISEDGYTYFSVPTDGAGAYSFPQVRPANYRVVVQKAGYLGTVYPNVRCLNVGSCSPIDVGGVVSVAPAGNTPVANIVLGTGATVSGNVTAASGGAPVQGAVVTIFDGARVVGSGTTDASGNFSATGIPDGTYRAWASNGSSPDGNLANLAPTAYGDLGCNEFLNCGTFGTPFTVTSGGPVAGVNIAMIQGGAIAGVISDAVVGEVAPSNRVRAEIFSAASGQDPGYTFAAFQQGTVPGSVSFIARGLAPGPYKVIFASTGLVGWVDTAFGGSPCPRGGCDQSVLPTVYVTAGATTSGVSGALPRGSIIRGNVTDAATGQPIFPKAFNDLGAPSQLLAFYNNLSNYAGFGQVLPDGTYQSRTGFLPGTLFSGTFLLRNNAPFGGGYIDQVYNGLPCPYLSCGGTTGAALTVTAGSDVNGVNYALSQGGAIAGTVTKAAGGQPLEGVSIEAYNAAGKKVGIATSNPLGRYRIPGLPASGTYYVRTQNVLGYQDKLYSAQTCEPFCNPVNGTAVPVTVPNTTGNVDFALDQSSTVSGAVSGSHSANVAVEIYGAVGNLLRSTVTDGAGAYTFADLAGGRYYVRTRNTFGDADALYNGKPCVGNACQVRRGDPIDVASGATASGKNLVLTSPGHISGQITDPAPLSGIVVALYDARGAEVGRKVTDPSGNYQFDGLATGNYFAVTRNSATYIDESFGDVPCPAACDGLSGTPIAVTAGNTSNANFLLSTGHAISGTVFLTVPPLARLNNGVVQVYNAGGVPVGSVLTNASGNYQVTKLPDGPFFVRTQNSQGYIDQLFSARTCNGYCDVVNGDAITLAGSDQGSKDFTLAPGGSISGSVTKAAGGAGIPLATVQVFDLAGVPAGSAQTDASGTYAVGGLKNGSYRVRTVNTQGFVNKLYNGLSCSPTPCDLATGAPVAVSGGAVSGINFSLVKGGSISGTATDQFNNPLPTGTATLFDANGVDVLSVPVANGLWGFDGLADGTYYVLIENNAGLIDQLYANQDCPAGACDIAAVGTPIVLSGGAAKVAVSLGPKALQSTAAIDLSLDFGQIISGNVKDAGTNAPIANATVYIFDSSGNQVSDGKTDGLGDFITTGGLLPGTYYAATANGIQRGVGANYVNQALGGGNCLLACTFTSGTPIVVSSSPVTGRNFALSKGIGFGGKVSDGSNQALAQITVEVYDPGGKLAGRFETNSLGRFVADGLPAGTYYARTRNDFQLQDELYGGAECAGNCNVLAGTAIVISNGNQPQNIDFSLAAQTKIFENGFE